MKEKSKQDYINELMGYRSRSVPTVSEISEQQEMPPSSVNENTTEKITEREPVVLPLNGMGSVIAVVTGGNTALPLKNASVTIIDTNTGQTISSHITDESGKTEIIPLPAPLINESLSPNDNGDRVFALYDIKAEAENYITLTNRNVPVFDKTVSIQQMNLLWIPASGGTVNPQEENEGNPYTL